MKKYIVFKVEDFDKFYNTTTDNGINKLIKEEVQDAEVIRHQDIAAGPIYSAYAHMILSFRDLLESHGMVNIDAAGNLSDIADHFHQASTLAEHSPHKRLPD